MKITSETYPALTIGRCRYCTARIDKEAPVKDIELRDRTTGRVHAECAVKIEAETA